MCLKNLSLSSAPVKEYLRIQAGDHAYTIAKAISKKERCAEDICEKLGLKISEVRAVLQRFYSLSFVSFSKAHDLTSNWIEYAWSLNLTKLLELVDKSYENKIAIVENRIETEDGTPYFSCKSNCRKLTLEEAMEVDFRCLICAGELTSVDNAHSVEKLKKLHATLVALSV